MSYGKYWEKYPIESGEVWQSGKSQIAVHDITKGLPQYMYNADMLYIDLPWNLPTINMFNKKANRPYMNSFAEFYVPLFRYIKEVNVKTCYLEIGKQERNKIVQLLSKVYKIVQVWPITYYKKNLCYLLRGADQKIDFDFTAYDDTQTPLLAIRQEKPKCVADFCTGRGLTGLAAFKYECDFVGTELNKRKLAVFIHKAKQLGYEFEIKKI